MLDRRGALDGALLVYDLSNPAAPEQVGALSVPGYPRDLALIGRYAFQRGAAGGVVSSEPTAPETRDLVAVAGGLLKGIGADGSGGSFQYLWIIDVSDPTKPVRVASQNVSFGFSIVNKLVWEAPYLFFLESSGDTTLVQQVHLQKFIYGANLSDAEFATLPHDGSPGLDANFDFDYVDPGDELPLPARNGLLFPGWEVAFSVPATTQRIIDFAVGRAGLFLGVALGGGCVYPLPPEGCQTTTAAGDPNPAYKGPQYRTLVAGTGFLDPDAASFDLPGEPKRVFFLGRIEIEVAGEPRIEDVVLVTVPGTPGRVMVLSVTDPLDPHELTTIEIDPSHGIVQSAIVRDDGFVALATTNDLLLLDPTYFGVGSLADAVRHPALAGVVPGAGSGSHTFASLDSGLHLTSLGGKSVVVQSAPRLEFVSFPADAPFDPSELAGQSADAVGDLIGAARFESSLQPARYRGVAGVGSSLLPPAAGTHYYVLVHAPGSAGETIDLALESLNANGEPLRSKGLLFPPVRAAGPDALAQLGQEPLPGEPDVAPLPAFRLSDDRQSALYNLYLSRPFALVYEEMSPDDLVSVGDELARVILWSGERVRASLEPSIEDNDAIGRFAASIDDVERVIRPGAVANARSLRGEYLMGPNPPPISGGVALADSMGTILAHSGEMRATVEDLFLRGRRMHLNFQRTNTGQSLYDGPFGRGWDFNWNQRVLPLRPEVFFEGQQMPLVIRNTLEQTEIAGSGDVIWYNGSGRGLVFLEAEEGPPPASPPTRWCRNSAGSTRRSASTSRRRASSSCWRASRTAASRCSIRPACRPGSATTAVSTACMTAGAMRSCSATRRAASWSRSAATTAATSDSAGTARRTTRRARTGSTPAPNSAACRARSPSCATTPAASCASSIPTTACCCGAKAPRSPSRGRRDSPVRPSSTT